MAQTGLGPNLTACLRSREATRLFSVGSALEQRASLLTDTGGPAKNASASPSERGCWRHPHPKPKGPKTASVTADGREGNHRVGSRTHFSSLVLCLRVATMSSEAAGAPGGEAGGAAPAAAKPAVPNVDESLQNLVLTSSAPPVARCSAAVHAPRRRQLTWSLSHPWQTPLSGMFRGAWTRCNVATRSGRRSRWFSSRSRRLCRRARRQPYTLLRPDTPQEPDGPIDAPITVAEVRQEAYPLPARRVREARGADVVVR